MVGTPSSPHRELHVALFGLLELGLISSPQLPPCPYKPKSPEALEVPCQLLRTTYSHTSQFLSSVLNKGFLASRVQVPHGEMGAAVVSSS